MLTDIDTNYYYRLTNQSLGDGYALESVDPGGQPLMTKNAGQAGQLWKLTPRGTYYQLSSLYNGEAYGMEGGAPNGGALNDAFHAAQGQLWSLIPQGNGWYRLTNQFMELSFANEYAFEGRAANGGALLTKWGSQGAQLWKLTKDRAVTPNVAVPSLRAGEGPSDIAAGTVNVYVVYTDFSDAPGTTAQIADLKARMTGGNQLVQSYTDQSYGKLKLNMTWGTTWKRMPQPITTYVPATGGWDYARFVTDAVGLVPTDLAQKPQIVVAAVPNTNKFIHSSAAHNVTVGSIHHEVNLCDVSYGEHYTTLMHEIGHCLGLVDLYPFTAPMIHKVGPWDIMGDIVYATGFLTWHRKILGWLDADRMTVLESGDVWNGAIAPSSSKFGTCMVAVRPKGNTSGSPDSLYIVQVAPDVRGRDGTLLSAEGVGVLVYKVCAAGPNDQKPLEVISNLPIPADSSKGLITSAPYPAGKIYDRPDLPFTLNVARRTGNAYYVDIRVR